MRTSKLSFRLHRIEEECTVPYTKILNNLDKKGHIQWSLPVQIKDSHDNDYCREAIVNFNSEMDESSEIRDVLLKKTPSDDNSEFHVIRQQITTEVLAFRDHSLMKELNSVSNTMECYWFADNIESLIPNR